MASVSNLEENEDQKPILGYYKLRGWAGPIRLMLAYLEVDHVEKLYPVPSVENGQGEWGQEKFSLGLDFPNLPYWIDSVVKLTETKAILKHIARMKDSTLLGKNFQQQAKIDELADVLWDLWLALTKICMENDGKGKQEFINEAFQKLRVLETFLGENSFAVGFFITYVDFLLHEILVHYEKFNTKLLEPFPKLRDFIKRLQAIPSINKYINSDKFIQGPAYSYKFKAKL